MASRTLSHFPAEIDRRAGQALAVWCIFLLLLVITNGTITFVFGADLHAWTASAAKAILVDLMIYAGFFLIVALIVTK